MFSADRRAFCRTLAGLGAGALLPARAQADEAFRTAALRAWRTRIGAFLARGVVPIIDTELTYNSAYDISYIIRSMDAQGVAQVCPAPFAGLGSQASLDLHHRYPEYFVPTTADGSSPHWYRDTEAFAARTRADLETGRYFLMGEFELRHYPSPLQHRAGRMDRDISVPLADRGVESAFQLAQKTGTAIQVHYEIEDTLLDDFEKLLERHPGARVVWCHLGQVRYPERNTRYGPGYVRSLIERFPNLHFDLGLPGPPHVHPASGARDQWIYEYTGQRPWGGYLKTDWRALLDAFPDRFLAASDVGGDRFREFERQIARLRALVLDVVSERARHLIAYRNAWRLIAREPWTD